VDVSRFLKNSRIIFNINENSYPLDVKFNFEKKHFPIEAIKIRMEEMHLKPADLAVEIGGKSRVSEILNRKRKLTVDMIRKLTARLNISASILVNDYPLSGNSRAAKK
jgi:antitoxin component HigA of HigAB toxin-antitoxin module